MNSRASAVKGVDSHDWQQKKKQIAAREGTAQVETVEPIVQVIGVALNKYQRGDGQECARYLQHNMVESRD
jgi:hypothetical protein